MPDNLTKQVLSMDRAELAAIHTLFSGSNNEDLVFFRINTLDKLDHGTINFVPEDDHIPFP